MASSKRENSNVVISASAIILDIEGTTSSISFVKDVLFPHVRAHLNDYVENNWDSAECQEITKALRLQAKEDEEKKVEGVILIPESEDKETNVKAVIDNVLWQMDNDRKTKSLKDLQGLIMEEGYKKGELKGHIYEDVESNIKSWSEQDKAVYIYSSGSVHAQKLLFGHSEKGDLLPFIKGHFDTTVGMKGESKSYKKILEDIACDPSEVAFLTDVPKEAKAAKEAGVYAVLVSREGNAPLTEENEADFPVISSFFEVEFDNGVKRRKLSDVNNENKQVENCEVSKDDNPDNPKPSTNGEVELMEVEESSEKETVAVEKKEKSKTVSILENKETEKAENVIDETKLSESGVAEKMESEISKEKDIMSDSNEPAKVKTPVDKEDKSLENNVNLDNNKVTDTTITADTTEESSTVQNGDNVAMDVQSENSCNEKQDTEPKSEESGTVCKDSNEDTGKVECSTSEPKTKTSDSNEKQKSSDVEIQSAEIPVVSAETTSSVESKVQDESTMETEAKPDSTVRSDETNHTDVKEEETKSQSISSSNNSPVSTDKPNEEQVKMQTSEAEATKITEASKEKANEIDRSVELKSENKPVESQLNQEDIPSKLDSTTEEKGRPTESQDEKVDTGREVRQLSEEKPVETKTQEVPITDVEPKVCDIDGTTKTDAMDTSQNPDANGPVKKTEVDLNKKEIKVPSDDKTEMTDEKTTYSHNEEEKPVENGAEVAQNGISNGHCTENLDGTSSPSQNGELSKGNEAQAIEIKKCVASSETTPTETVVEA